MSDEFRYGDLLHIEPRSDQDLRAALCALETAILYRCQEDREQCLTLLHGLTGLVMRSEHLPAMPYILAAQPFQPLADQEDLKSLVQMYDPDGDAPPIIQNQEQDHDDE